MGDYDSNQDSRRLRRADRARRFVGKMYVATGCLSAYDGPLGMKQLRCQNPSRRHGRWWPIAGIVLALLCGEGRAEPKSFMLDDREVVKMKRIAKFYGLKYQRNPVRLAGGNHSFSFSTDSRKVLYNGILFWLYEPLQRKRGSWLLAEVDRTSFIDPLLRPGRYLVNLPDGPVFLDPGHGGNDAGAQGLGGTVEKHLALETCRMVRKHLLASGIAVRLTRVDDQFVELKERCRIAKQGRGSLFISIHYNSASNRKAEGVETYILPQGGLPSTAGNLGNISIGNQFDGANLLLAQAVHKHTIRASSVADRGIKKSRFSVLKYAPCPALLVECGFLSNQVEEKRIKSVAYRESLADGIARGIEEYLRACRAHRPAGVADVASRR